MKRIAALRSEAPLTQTIGSGQPATSTATPTPDPTSSLCIDSKSGEDTRLRRRAVRGGAVLLASRLTPARPGAAAGGHRTAAAGAADSFPRSPADAPVAESAVPRPHARPDPDRGAGLPRVHVRGAVQGHHPIGPGVQAQLPQDRRSLAALAAGKQRVDRPRVR
jgi:hypothetical protein